jgi:hypothetical protein
VAGRRRRVLLDGVELGHVAIARLRAAISIIPQVR